MSDLTVSLSINEYQEFLTLAKDSYDRSLTSDRDVIVTIVFSALAVECFLNNVLEVARYYEPESTPVKIFVQILDEPEKQKASIKAKIQLAYYILTNQSLNTGNLPYQDFDLLLDLRNAFVHGKQDVVIIDNDTLGTTPGFKPHKFVHKLASRKVISLPPENHVPQWQPFVTKPEVARWAYNTAVAMIMMLFESLPESQAKWIMSMGILEVKPI